ncbi:hypothetical protein J6A31_07250 [bacterium]|nr:hypothetical protein [bacterium]
MKLKFLSVILSLVLFAGAAFAGPFNANAKTKRIPAGTKLSLELLTPVTTTASAGTEFSAVILSDQTYDSDVILPSGSLVRGVVNKVVPSERLSKGAVLYMDFDHVVTPNGRQLPLTLSITGRTDLTYDGGITTTRGFGDAFKKTLQKSGDITVNAVEWGKETFQDTGKGYVKYVAVPVCAIGGALGTAGYFVYDTVADLIRKGADVNLKTGDVIQVILVDPIDVPVI